MSIDSAQERDGRHSGDADVLKARAMRLRKEWMPDDFADQMRDGHLFLSDEMALKYSIDAKVFGWTRDADLCGWHSPYINPWTIIHRVEGFRTAVAAHFPDIVG